MRLIGLFVSLLKKDRRSYGAAYVLFWFISSFVISSLIEINVTRINAIFFSVAFIAVYGMYCIWVMTEYLITKLFNTEFAKKIAVWVTILSILFATAVYAKNFSFFARYYYGGQYEKEYAWLPLFEPAVDEAIAFLEENPEYKGSSCHTSAFDCVLALALKMSPYEFDRLEENEYWNPLSFPAVEPGMSFIMSNTNVDYMNRLRNGGYSEYDFGKYTIFYWNK